MEGNLSGFRDEDRDVEREACPASHSAPRPRRYLFPVLTFAFLFGLIAATAAILNSGILSGNADVVRPATGNWRISALLITAIAAAWFAGAVQLAMMVFQPVRGSGNSYPGISAWLAAFAVGPFLVALFLFAISLTQGVNTRLAALAVPGSIMLVVIFGRRRYHLMAERLLVALVLWIAILIVPTFWRDAVNLQMSEFLFGLLNTAGLL